MPIGTRGKKPTDAEKQRRIQEVYGLLAKAASRQEIMHYCAEKWDVGERCADAYIKDTRVLIEKDCEMSRQAFLAECFARLRTYEAMAAKRGQMQVATNSGRLEAELVGLTSKSVRPPRSQTCPVGLFFDQVLSGSNLCRGLGVIAPSRPDQRGPAKATSTPGRSQAFVEADWVPMCG